MDNGAHFDPLPGTLNGVIPPAVLHLAVDTEPEGEQYRAKAHWDTPRIIKGVRFIVRLTTGAGTDDDPVRLVTSATTSETAYAFHNLPLGDYTLTVRAMNSFGQQGEPASVTFSIQAPEPPATIELTPGYFQITVTPHQTYYDPGVQYEFWYSAVQLNSADEITARGRRLGTATWQVCSGPFVKPGHDHYFYVRSVNVVGKSAFAEAVGQPSNDAQGYLELFGHQINQWHLAQELWSQIDNAALKGDIATIEKTVDETKSEIAQTVNKTLENQSTTIQQIQRVQRDTDNALNAMWAVKLQRMQDGRLYIAGIGSGIENTPEGIQSQILMMADRLVMINPANGNTVPVFVAQGDQIFMNEVLMKTATIDFANITGQIQSDNFRPGAPGWRLSRNGLVEINSGDGDGRSTFTGQRLEVYDKNNVLQVRIGKL
ncbi:DUF1983 domain-containing protein [Salmonella enterica subsp. enterica serovar Rubislaw]|nr:DUF1983 domain-containing protein [Salmonella enterica]EBL5125064.1 DUF1983 domain-containing protein [Salmonella enterica subsp. enterica serovar Rubislaw]